MKTQISRDGWNPGKRYSGVYQQQGRMLTDRDWNELMDIVKARLDAALYDVFGSGSPRNHGAQVQKDTPQSAVRLRPGPVYVDGVGALVAPAPTAPAGPTIAFDQQAGFPTPPALPAAGQVYLLYTDVWERAVTSLEDPGLRDPALQGADTCTRTQPLAQIKWCQGKDPENPLHNPSQGNATLTAMVPQGTGEDAADPCDPQLAEVDPLGNDHLFRLEVHDVRWPQNATPVPETPDRVVIKWSRENGAEQQEFGDETDDFKAPPFVFELYQTAAEEHLGLHLVPGGGTPPRGTLVAPFPAAPPASSDPSPFFARRWDGYCVLLRQGNAWKIGTGVDDPQTTAPGAVVSMTNNSLSIKLAALELTLDLSGKVFLPGDFWLVPVRVATHDPGAVLLNKALPQGIVHRYLTLAQVDANGSLHPQSTIENRRRAFPRLTELAAADVSYQTLCPPGSLLTAAQDTVQKALDQICSLAATNVAFTKASPDTGVFKGKNPHTVAEALTLLCNVSADQVAFTQAQFPAVQDVKAGLNELFGRPVGGSGRITVGVGGQYATLALAMADLAGQQKRTDIALALLPGDHVVDSGVNLGGFLSPVNLSILGVGSGSRLLTQSSLVFNNLSSFSLERVAIEFLFGTGLMLSACKEVILTGNRLSGDQTTNPLVSITAAERIRLRDNWIDVPWSITDPNFMQVLAKAQTLGGVADMQDLFGVGADKFASYSLKVAQDTSKLTLSARQAINAAIVAALATVSVTNEEATAYKSVGTQVANNVADPAGIAGALLNLRTVLHLKNPGIAMVLFPTALTNLEGNRIVGFLSIYGSSQGGGGLTPIQSQALVTATQANKFSMTSASGSLRLANNVLTGVRLNKPYVDAIVNTLNNNGAASFGGVFQSMEIANTTFEKGDNQFMATHVGLTGCSFLRSGENAGWVLAMSALYVGNRAVSSPAAINLWSAVRAAGQTDIGNLLFTIVKQ